MAQKTVFRSDADARAYYASAQGQKDIIAADPSYASRGTPLSFDDWADENDLRFDPNAAGDTNTGGTNTGKGTGSTKPAGSQAVAPPSPPFGGGPIVTGPSALSKSLKGVIAPQYQQLKEEVLAGHPALALDETTQNILKAQGVSIEAMLRGDIPADVQAKVSQIAAEKALRGGISGQSARNLQARDLGLTSLEIQEKGRAAATDFVAKEREWAGMKSDFLLKAHELDLKGVQLRTAAIQLDATILNQRIQTVGTLVSSYWDSVYKMSSLKKPNQASIDSMTRDFQASMVPLAYQGGSFNRPAKSGRGVR